MDSALFNMIQAIGDTGDGNQQPNITNRVQLPLRLLRSCTRAHTHDLVFYSVYLQEVQLRRRGDEINEM